MRHALADTGLKGTVGVDSAGLGGWHAGNPPDDRSVRCAGQRGYDLAAQRARQFRQADYEDFAIILGMDRSHVRELLARRPDKARADVRLFLEFLPADDPHHGNDVPDPYYGGMEGYEICLDLIERGMPSVIEAIRRAMAEDAGS